MLRVLPADALTGANSSAAANEANATLDDKTRWMDLDMEFSGQCDVDGLSRVVIHCDVYLSARTVPPKLLNEIKDLPRA
jgi:hypothetical protein